MADTKATYEVLKAQIDRYEGVIFDNWGKKTTPITNNIDSLASFSAFDKNVDFAGRIIYDDSGVEIFNFGKHKGKAVEKVFKEEPGYYSWMMQGEFPLYTKKVLTAIKLKEMNRKL